MSNYSPGHNHLSLPLGQIAKSINEAKEIAIKPLQLALFRYKLLGFQLIKAKELTPQMDTLIGAPLRRASPAREARRGNFAI